MRQERFRFPCQLRKINAALKHFFSSFGTLSKFLFSSVFCHGSKRWKDNRADGSFKSYAHPYFFQVEFDTTALKLQYQFCRQQAFHQGFLLQRKIQFRLAPTILCMISQKKIFFPQNVFCVIMNHSLALQGFTEHGLTAACFTELFRV